MKKAFTLAEVLITLGIIGVVSTITIPTLISFENQPSSFVIHAKNARMGEQKANTVHPIINVRLYTPFVIAAVT